ncbi:MAG: cytochrome c biogenesis protein CcsA [Saprospiraceae bacterium]|nr:cytochrome c biogenesis protein CcsA [Saprospiraceae bacterium]
MDFKKFGRLISKVGEKVFNTRAAGLYLLVFAASIGIATFIENDYGTSSAQKLVYKSWWFELLLFLFCGTLVFNIIRFRMIGQKKWALLLFHSAMIIIILGAGITRYFGYEGMMHIREDDTSNRFLSSDTYLKFEVEKESELFAFDESVFFASLGKNEFRESYLLGNDLIDVELVNFIPNPQQVIESDPDGIPIIQMVMAGMGGREKYILSQGDRKRINNLNFNFSETYIPGAINITYKNKQLGIKTDQPITQMLMANQQLDTLMPGAEYHTLMLRSLYSIGSSKIVFDDFKPAGKLMIMSEAPKLKNESVAGLVMSVSINGSKEETIVYGQKGLPGRPVTITHEDIKLSMSYGAKYIDLPFYIRLYDFIMEKYPGTNSAASYASEVQLVDPRNDIKKDYRIYMNNILTYGGYRFFQSSFDKDEKGTYLSVNHDFWGTWVSYIGYGLLTIGMLWIFFDHRSRFQQVSRKVNKAGQLAILVLFLFNINLNGQKVINPQVNGVSQSHAGLFSQMVVQDHRGRMKPIHTLSRELLRKMSRKESLLNMNADQVVLSMFADNETWRGVSLIKLSKNKKIQEMIGVGEGDLVAYKDFFDRTGKYKLQEEVRRAYSLQPIDRGMLEKDLMKIDERVNIASMIYSGRIFRVIPIENDPNNTWVSSDAGHGTGQSHSVVAEKFFSSYQSELHKSLHSNDWSLPDQILSELSAYQQKHGLEVMPSSTEVKTEIFLNNLNVFSRLSLYYSVLGLGFLVLLFLSVFRPDASFNKFYQVLFWLAIGGFIFHTCGLGMRWYVSGRAPWSNGYESMIYIAWTTTLAGLIFTRKSYGGLAATMILAGTILLVAMLSYLDPEITPLVPVLRSYWLTIHVSLIAGSYGFLMLGAIIGLINLILMIFFTDQNKDRITRIIREMTHISELTLMGGLIMISIGTYLGGVWANESWGRYWGWDAKETWALVTILVYAFILHMRIIPKIYNLYSYNLATLFGWASVIMTYFGVNYYLSGLHSYAAGDPIPIPTWVYISVVAVAIISILAWWRKRPYAIS